MPHRVVNQVIEHPLDEVRVTEQRFAQADRSEPGSEEGAGLGLAVSLAIVEAHHGRIEVADGEGGGAVFRVALPSR